MLRLPTLCLFIATTFILLLAGVLTPARAAAGYPDEWLYYTVGRPQTGYVLYRSTVAGRDPVQITSGPVRNVAYADDGRTFYFLRYANGNTVQELYRFDVVSGRERLLARFNRTVQRVRVLGDETTALLQVRRGFCNDLVLFDLARQAERGTVGVTTCDEKPAWFGGAKDVYFRGRLAGDLGIVRLATQQPRLRPEMVATSGAPVFNNAWMVYFAAGLSTDPASAATIDRIAAAHDFELHAYYDTASVASSAPQIAYTSANDLYTLNTATGATTRLFDGDFDTRYLEVYFMPTPRVPFEGWAVGVGVLLVLVGVGVRSVWL